MADNTFNVSIIEKELIKVNLNKIEVLNQQTTVTADWEDDEVPTPVGAYPTARFRTAFVYNTSHLKVYLNGLKQTRIGSITTHDNREFSIDQPIPSDWKIECSYIKE